MIISYAARSLPEALIGLLIEFYRQQKQGAAAEFIKSAIVAEFIMITLHTH